MMTSSLTYRFASKTKCVTGRWRISSLDGVRYDEGKVQQGNDCQLDSVSLSWHIIVAGDVRGDATAQKVWPKMEHSSKGDLVDFKYDESLIIWQCIMHYWVIDTVD